MATKKELNLYHCLELPALLLRSSINNDQNAKTLSSRALAGSQHSIANGGETRTRKIQSQRPPSHRPSLQTPKTPLP